MSAITIVNSSIKNNSGDTVLIPLLIGNYNTVKSNAFSANLLSYNSSTKQVYDVPGRSENPYDLKSLFAACPLKKETISGSETFIVKSNTIWNNTSKSISQLQIDFADGQGFQSISIGSPIAVSYTDTGYKRWMIKVTLNDNSILQCYNDYYVLGVESVGTRYQAPQSIIPAWGFISPVAGTHSGAIVWVNYNNLNRTNTLRKPLIVVEGYDVSNIAPSLQPNYDISDFILAINEPRNTYDFNSQLDDIAGYDLVFVDFNNGADDIVRNAAVVQEVINRVNANKVNDNRFGNIRQQNIVMGLSMGGICARYALANMTKNFPSTPTETRLLITHDSPHRGANVPLGLQYLIRMMGGFQLFGYNVYDIYPDYNDAIGLLDAPATRQLLLYRSVTANTYEANTFLDGTYRGMITFAPTDPQPTYRFVATSLGSECAHPLFDPGKTFINLGAGVSAGITGRVLFFRVPILTYKLAAEVEAYALPPAGSNNKIARLYTVNNLKLFGIINIYKQLYDNTAYAPGNHIPVDGAPGSNYPLLDVQGLNQLTSLPVFNPVSLYVQFPLGPFFGGYFGVYAYNAGVSWNFTFVPVPSALDANPYNVNTISQTFVNGTNRYYPSSSETFIAQETNNIQGTTNNAHIRFTARNSRYLFNEMENLNNNENCSSECFNNYSISGPDWFCTSGSYFIQGLPRGANVSWSFIPRGAIALTPTTGFSTTATKQRDGLFRLTANITNACGTGSYTIYRDLTAGPPPVTIVGPYDPVQHTIMGVPCVGQQYYFIATDIETGQSYTWTLSPPPGSNDNPTLYSGSTVYLTFNETGYYTLQVSKTNNCGTSISSIQLNVQDCLNGFSVIASPNPASSELTVTITNESENVSSLSRSELIKMEVYEFNSGTKQKQWTFINDKKQFTLNLNGISKGAYLLKVTKGRYSQSTKIIIQ